MKLLLLLLLAVLVAPSEQSGPFPSSLYPPPKGSSEPRLYVSGRLAELTARWNDPTNAQTQLYKHELDKLMAMTQASEDWRYRSGWPAAALGLAYQLSGDVNYGKKAISVFLPAFTGVPFVSGRLQSCTHYALAYDFLQGHPDFTSAQDKSLRDRLVSWSQREADSDDYGGPNYIGDDSDHLTAATTSHLVAGMAVYTGPSDSSAIAMMDRGWRGWTVGFNNNPSTLQNISIEFMYGSTMNGHGLPGWDYFWMSDGWDLQSSWNALDAVGYDFDATYADGHIKQWFAAAIKNFISSIPPGRATFHWMGDCQSDVRFDPQQSTTLSEVFDWMTTNVYFAAKYGYSKEAAWGRFFLQQLATQYNAEPGWSADPMLQFVYGYAANAAQIDYTADATFPRLLIDAVGADQSMSYGYFRSDWQSSATWGGISGVGSYLVDHMHNSAGSFWLYRNGEYLASDPHSYGGQTFGNIYLNLGIPNGDHWRWYVSEMSFAMNHDYDAGGPIPYWSEGTTAARTYPAAHISRRHVTQSPDLFYAAVALDHAYNVAYTDQWHTACGTQNPNPCGQPVVRYQRHFLWDGADLVLTIDRPFLRSANWTSYRFRTQNANKAPTKVSGNGLFSAPSDRGTYRTLVRFLSPPVERLDIFAETPAWQGSVSDSDIDKSMWGYEVKAFAAPATSHTWLTAMHMGTANSPNTALDDAAIVHNAAGVPVGIQAGQVVFVTSDDDQLTTALTYTTPASTPANSRHLVADMTPGCYAVTADGSALGKFPVDDEDNTVTFTHSGHGSQTFVVAAASGCTGTTQATTSSQTRTSSTTQTGTTTKPTTTKSATTTKTRTGTGTTSGSGGSGGCFAAESTVRVLLAGAATPVSRPLHQLRAGDLVESFDADTMRSRYTPVVYVAHAGDDKRVPLLAIRHRPNTDNDVQQLRLTPNHLVLAASDASARPALLRADQLKPGHVLFTASSTDELKPSRVIDVQPTVGRIRNPLTVDDHIVVDGVAASVYVESAAFYRTLVAPLKLWPSLASSPLAQWLLDRVLVPITDFVEPRVAALWSTTSY